MAEGNGIKYMPGAGPPPGTPRITLDDAIKSIEKQAGTPGGIDQTDPAFVAGTPKADASRAEVFYRDLPLVTVQNSWSVQDVRAALNANMYGIFDLSAQLWDSILGDDRVQATLGSRIAGLFGREVRFTPADDSDAAKECLRAWMDAWPEFSGGTGLRNMHAYAIGMGWMPAQLVWDTSKPIWRPRPVPWHPRFTYYHWSLRKYIALSMDGSLPIIPGDGKWMLHAPYGDYRAWIFGALRATAEPWLLRHFAFRDMARYSEVHGMPIRKAKVPAASDAIERSQYGTNVANLGNETTILIQQGVDGTNGYDLELLEAKDPSWEVFSALISQCDMAIILAIMFQNLTTEVDSGSFAATKAHMDIRQNGIQSDATAWQHTIYHQAARPFAQLNFGDADLAPRTEWDVTPREYLETNAKQFQAFGTALEVMARGGLKFKDSEEVRRFAASKFGLDNLPDFDIGDPISGGLGGGSKSKLPFTDVDPSSVVTVNEARSLNDLPKMPGGDVTIQEFHAGKDAEREKDVNESSEQAKADAAPVKDAAE